jgi:signal peptidase II
MRSRLAPRALAALLFCGVAALGSGCDVATKSWAEGALGGDPPRTMTILAPYLELELRHNTGTAFSVIPDLGAARVGFGLFSFAVVLALIVVVLRRPEQHVQTLALAALAAGAIGNGIDRITGAPVVDFIRVNYPWGGSWPTFNVADVLVAVGVIVLLLQSFVAPPQPPSPGHPPPPR